MSTTNERTCHQNIVYNFSQTMVSRLKTLYLDLLIENTSNIVPCAIKTLTVIILLTTEVEKDPRLQREDLL